MVVENEEFSFVVTHVESTGNKVFLTIWAKTEQKIIESVDTLLQNLQDRLNNISLLDKIPEASDLFGLPDGARPFILADVMPINGTWDDETVHEIRENLVNKQFFGVFQVINNIHTIKIQSYNQDFGNYLVQNKIALYSSFMNQQMVQSLPVRVEPSKPKITKTYALKTIQLEIDSIHDVKISFVEDGPRKFSVQLLNSIPNLESMMMKINSQSYPPLQEAPVAGAVCLGRQTHTNRLCRVVINSPGEYSCKAYFVDYGYNEVLHFTNIYQIPDEFVDPHVFSIRFTLSDTINWIVSQDMKIFFIDLVTKKILKLKVCKSPMSPLTQYCDLYLNEKSIRDMLFNKFPDECKLPYCKPKVLQKGSTEDVFVSYVVSPSKFFVQLKRDSKQLDEITEQINEIVPNAEYIIPFQIRKGMPCLAFYDFDKNWYRAIIIDFIHNYDIRVAYVDFGNEKKITIDDLRVIPRNLVEIHPKQAITCSLCGIPSGSDVREHINNLKALVSEKYVSLTVQDVFPDTILVDMNVKI